MLIKKIEEKYILDCAYILKKEYSKKPYNEEFIPKSELKYVESKVQNNEDNCFVATIDGKVVWFCFWSLSYWADWVQWIIEEIVVDSDYQWKWVWKELYFTIENYFKEKNVKSLMLWVQNDANAYNFHLKNWFFKSDEHSIMFKNL